MKDREVRKISIEEIYLKYFKPVYYFLVKLTKNETLAEDITSETFIKVINSIDSFRGDTNIYSWICQIAKNTYFSYLKANNKYSYDELLDSRISISEEDFSMNLYNKYKIQMVNSILLEFSEDQRKVFYLRTYEELSFKEIGNILNKNENWACVTFYRLKKKIKDEMEDVYE